MTPTDTLIRLMERDKAQYVRAKATLKMLRRSRRALALKGKRLGMSFRQMEKHLGVSNVEIARGVRHDTD